METIALIQPFSTPPHQELSIETPTNEENEENGENEVMSLGLDYEKCREQRIKENKERLQKMGIVDLSLKLKTAIASSRRAFLSERKSKTPLKSLSLGPTLPPRRSSRLQNTSPVTYTELKEEKPRRGSREILLEVGTQPEVYTEEHEKLLGSTELPWTFSVDGYGPDGRIYDPVKGKTCHQCRQKTLGLRTHCSRCQIVQGQFCGDCLYARYGEHVVEASKNPDWICPPCRGICNCSLCRQAKGWPPTGMLYKKVKSLGYRSVAHFLIATKRAPTSTDKSAETPQSVKRSIPFKDMDVQGDDESGDGLKSERKMNSKKEKATSVNDNGGSRKRAKKEDELKELISENKENNKEEVATVDDPKMSSKRVGRPPKRTKKENDDESGDDLKSEKTTNCQKKKATSVDKRNGGSGKRTKKEDEPKELISENKENNKEEVDTVDDPKMSSKRVGRPPKGTKKENEAKSSIEGSSALAPDSIARRLRSRCRT